MGAAKKLRESFMRPTRRRNRRKQLKREIDTTVEVAKPICKNHTVLHELARQILDTTVAECRENEDYVFPTSSSKWITDWFFYVHDERCLAYPTDVIDGNEVILHVQGKLGGVRVKKVVDFTVVRRCNNRVITQTGEPVYLYTEAMHHFLVK